MPMRAGSRQAVAAGVGLLAWAVSPIEAVREKNAARHILIANSSATIRLPTDDEKSVFLDTTNQYRCMHGADPLVWDDSLAKYIGLDDLKDGATYNLGPPAGPAAQNTFVSGAVAIPEAALRSWYGEGEHCKGGITAFTDGCANGDTGHNTGHFTALVWRGAKKVGCAFSEQTSPQNIICRYKAGDTLSNDIPNMNKDKGEYPKHVFPQSKKLEECFSTKAEKDQIEYMKCVAAGSVANCGRCTHNIQCTNGNTCDSRMKLCSVNGAPCFGVMAGCADGCDKDDVTQCVCEEPTFPRLWLGAANKCPRKGATTTTTTTTTRSGGTSAGPLALVSMFVAAIMALGAF